MLRAHRSPDVPRVDKSSLQVRCASTTSFRSPDQRWGCGRQCPGSNLQITQLHRTRRGTRDPRGGTVLRDRGQRRTLLDRVGQLLPGEPSTTSTATSARRTDRRRRQARGGLRLAGSLAEIGRPPGNRARRKGGCSLHTRGYPVSMPDDIENRGVATGIDRELNPNVIGPIMPPPHLTEPTRLNLSRLRHGFEPRWDYAWSRIGCRGHRTDAKARTGKVPIPSTR